MDYIVFDLEWNQCPYGKARENPALPFEIIEIGAVRVGEDMEIRDTFHTYIKPTVYRRIHYRTHEVIGLNADDLKDGMTFPDAARAFLEFCGKDYRFCTWGPLDLYEFQRNLKFYEMDQLIKFPLYFEDVQKLFAVTYEREKDRRSLSYAAEFLKMDDQGDFHHALDDALYTAKVLVQIPKQTIKERFTVDIFKVPRTKKEEVKIQYPTYEKYITRTFDTSEALMSDRGITTIRCRECGKAIPKKMKWFATGNHVYRCIALCQEHGYAKGKMRLKKTDEGLVFGVRTVKMVDEEAALKVAEKKKPRRKKSKNKNNN
ncbi:MAG: exonuclease domain-containing protein [Lachnospiraceae bacterium]|nr:exonuclease domain-containing protein [Candidatus Equihabitans merdae]